MNEKQKIDEKELYRVRIGHYQTLVQALAVAMTRNLAWRDADEGQTFSLKELYEFAQKYDVQHPLDEYQFFMVSREGAIGLSPGLEWMTKWLFYPMEPGKERDFVLQRMREQLQVEKAVDEAVEKAVLAGLAAEKQAPQADDDVVVIAAAATAADDDDDATVAAPPPLPPRP